jgi:hypothetical protein
MIISGRRRGSWVLGTICSTLCAATLAIAGCGSDGKASVIFPPTPKPEALVTGVVLLPNGQLVSTNGFWQWADAIRLLAPASATTTQNASVFPTSGVRVSLSRVDQADAADGVIGGDSPHGSGVGVPLAQSLDTDASGNYTIYRSSAADSVDGCGFMLSVGNVNQFTLTRAFVLAEGPGTDVDVVSETVVRVVLNRLTKAPPVQLCEFPLGSPGLQAITDAVSDAVFTATGSNVEEINQAGFEKAMANANVRAAIDAATGIPVAN